jgi:hypothetical protein
MVLDLQVWLSSAMRRQRPRSAQSPLGEPLARCKGFTRLDWWCYVSLLGVARRPKWKAIVGQGRLPTGGSGFRPRKGSERLF